MKGSILVIEDNVNWQNDIREIFENANYHVQVVSNVDEGILAIKKHLFHFITLDMQLDEKTITENSWEGWTVLEIAKKLRTEKITPIMVITAFGTKYHKLKADKRLESLFFMEKQYFDEDILLETVAREIKRHDLRFFNDHRDE